MSALRPWRRLAGGAAAAAATSAAARLVRAAPSGARDRWEPTNHAGHPVSLLEGPEYVVGAAVGSLLTGSLAGLVAAAGAGALGALDDLAGNGSSKGLHGHLAALRRGRVTTGAVKVVGLALTGVVAVVIAQAESNHDVTRHPRTSVPDLLVGGAVVAGTANLVNLLDLRPGRALKMTLLLGAPLALTGSRAAPAAVGSAAAALRDDLAGVSMLGDTGANAAGALLGVALLERLGRRGRLVALGVLTALTLTSEKVSFTTVIESTPVLRELDAWGRPSVEPGGEPSG